MKTLVIGTGGREHALVLALSRDPGVTEVHAAPGNPGMAGLATLHAVDPMDPAAVAELATRVGADIGFKQGPWRTGASVIQANAQDRLAASETRTPSYTQVDASLSYVQRLKGSDITWFLLGKNLLNEDIRLSTSVLKDQTPLPGRNLVVGMRTRF